MMKQYILIMLFVLAGLAGMAQTNEPLPGDAEPLTNQLYLSPSDSTVWASDPFSGLAIKVGTWFKVDSLFKLGYTKVQVDSAITVNISFHNVKSFGAVGDGVTDDTEAIRDAMAYLKSSGDGRLFFPEGVYMISGTVYVPSDVEIFGDGKEKSIIKNTPTAALDTVVVLDVQLATGSAIHLSRYKAMWSTETAPYTSADSSRNIRIRSMGFDWNGVEAGLLSPMEIIIGRAVDCHVYDVKLFDCLPDDLENPSVRRSGGNILFAFASDCSLYDSQVGASDYESVSIRFLSKNIRIYNNIFDINKPNTFGVQTHAIQTARPSALANDLEAQYGETRPGPAYVYDNTFLLRSNVGHAFTAHASTGVNINGNYIKSFSTNNWNWGTRGGFGIKVFSGSDEAIITGNIIDFSDLGNIAEQTVTAIGLSDNDDINEDPITKAVVTGNIVRVNQSAVATDPETNLKPAIGTRIGIADNVAISDNIIEITGYRNEPISAIAVSGDGVSVSGNSITYSNPSETIDSNGPVAISVSGDAIAVSNNSVSGEQIYGGIIAQPGSTNITENQNSFSNLVGPELTGDITWFVDNKDQTIPGNKTWAGSHVFIPGSQGVQPEAGIRLAGLPGGPLIAGSPNGSSNASFILRTYTQSGVQLTLNAGAVSAPQYRLSALNTAPASATATGTTGEIRVTATHIYVCVATDTWVRAALTTW